MWLIEDLIILAIAIPVIAFTVTHIIFPILGGIITGINGK